MLNRGIADYIQKVTTGVSLREAPYSSLHIVAGCSEEAKKTVRAGQKLVASGDATETFISQTNELPVHVSN